MYDGTVRTDDPNLVATFELDDQTTAYVVRDVDAGAPDWDGIGYVFAVSYDHPRYDSLMIGGDTLETRPTIYADDVRGAWDRFRDRELVTRYLRMFHDAADVDYSQMIQRDSTILAVVTRSHVDAWGCQSPDGLAAQALETYRQWAEGEVYGVIVVNTVTGSEESLWDVYDGTPDFTYCQQVAQDIAPIGVAV